MHFNKPAVSALLLLSFSAVADVQLTRADILGKWQIDKESMHADGRDARDISTVWNFREDGTMEGTSNEVEAHSRINQMRAVLNYSIEDGKLIKQAAAGRSKMDTCQAIEKDNNKLVLKCGASYFFMTKK